MNSENFETIEGLCEALTSSYTAIEECLDELKPRTRRETSVVSCIRKENELTFLFLIKETHQS